MKTPTYTLDFGEIGLEDAARVGGKNASLGELLHALKPLGVGALDGFSTTTEAYRRLLAEKDLGERLGSILSGFDPENVGELAARGQAARAAVLETPIPGNLQASFLDAYERLCERLQGEVELAVRSSATAEDLPGASFAGQQETFLNVRGRDALLRAIHACFASLFTDRAINYRQRHGFDHLKVSLSAGVQPMVRADKGTSGVIFTLDPESGFRDAVVVTGAYGLGEFVVQGVVTPDEWTVFKPTLSRGARPIIGRRLGSKHVRLVYADGSKATRSEPVAEVEQRRFSLRDTEVLQLAKWACVIEEHYSRRAGHAQPMDIEWAKDGITGELYILQARPETVHSSKTRTEVMEVFRLGEEHGPPLVTGQAVGERIGSGAVRVVREARDLAVVKPGDVLVAEMTDPDWEPVMKQVAAIVTDRGGRTAHAAIVSRELGLPCVVGTGNATEALKDCQAVTVSCAGGAEGKVYAGRVPFATTTLDVSAAPRTRTKILLNVADPGQAFRLAALPSGGVGLARMEFIVAKHIGIHPMAAARYPSLKDRVAAARIAEILGDENPTEFFVSRLSEGIGRIAAAFFPKPVIVRTSDFKTNEYAKLLGGSEFEPNEENPMLGFRGACRYCDIRYRDGFVLECAALARVRDEMGLTNVKVMIPFTRSVKEAENVIGVMASHGLCQGRDGLEVYGMCELPTNVVLAEQFLRVFDGYSIGSNDLTQLVLGIDRDSGTVSHLFDERDPAVLDLIGRAIEAAKKVGKPIGICGQAPSDYPEFAGWLVERGIDSISLNPDALLKTLQAVASTESMLQRMD